MVQEDIGGNLHSDITDVEDREQRSKLGTMQIQVFLESAKSSRGSIIPVNL
jgi:hypothetical protein